MVQFVLVAILAKMNIDSLLAPDYAKVELLSSSVGKNFAWDFPILLQILEVSGVSDTRLLKYVMLSSEVRPCHK